MSKEEDQTKRSGAEHEFATGTDSPAPLQLSPNKFTRGSEFAFLVQAGVVEDLLKAAEHSLTSRTPESIDALKSALRTFEHYTAPVVYGADDVAGIDSGLSLEDRLDVLDHYAHNYDTKDADLYAIQNSIAVIRGDHN